MPKGCDSIILCGGAGVRLKSVVGDLPKPMARIGERPFLELLLSQLTRGGFSRVILSAGYKQEMIQKHFGAEALGLKLVYSLEASPLGTGGALREASQHCQTDQIVVMNGDSYADVDFGTLMAMHLKSSCDATLVVSKDTRSDAGSVEFGENGRLVTFAEKRPVANSNYKSAGIYVFHRNLLASISGAGALSLEEDLFPKWLEKGVRIGTFIFSGACIDIGTPERYRAAQTLLANVER